MAPRGSRKSNQEARISEHGIYCCSHCGRPLQLEKVMRSDVERLNGVATGYVVFEHFCGCDSRTLRSSRGWGSHPSFVVLFGEQPSLPYESPFACQGVDDDDPIVARWRWELSQVADWDDFVLFLDDAAGTSN